MMDKDSLLKIEVLYFNDCPSWKNTVKDLELVLKELGIKKEISFVAVETHKEAIKQKFTGSPTIRINDKDIFPNNQINYALGCRVYLTPQGYKGTPTKEMIRTQIEELLLNYY